MYFNGSVRVMLHSTRNIGQNRQNTFHPEEKRHPELLVHTVRWKPALLRFRKSTILAEIMLEAPYHHNFFVPGSSSILVICWKREERKHSDNVMRSSLQDQLNRLVIEILYIFLYNEVIYVDVVFIFCPWRAHTVKMHFLETASWACFPGK